MKKFFFLLAFISSINLSAQNFAFEQIGLSVKPGSEATVLKLVEDYYGGVKKPVGVNIALNSVAFKGNDVEVTHFLSFTGSVPSLAELRKIRSGDKYALFNSAMMDHAKIINQTAGSTLVRINPEKGLDPIAQVWRFKVIDAASFAEEFSNLLKAVPQPGYLSLGQFSHGISALGETHYIYETHKDYETAIGWGPKTEQEQQAFINFNKKISGYATFLGTYTTTNVKNW